MPVFAVGLNGREMTIVQGKVYVEAESAEAAAEFALANWPKVVHDWESVEHDGTGDISVGWTNEVTLPPYPLALKVWRAGEEAE